MSDLIAYTRKRINDPASASQVFTDNDVQDALDRYQVVVRYALATRAPTIKPNGIVDVGAYRDYYANEGYWEADVALYDAAYNLLSPDTSDLLTGHWVFNAGVLPVVWVVGKIYDLYASAADLLENWAAMVALNFDFKTNFDEFHQSQMREALQAMAASYRKRAKPMVATQYRPDVAQGWPIPGPLDYGVRDL